MACWLAGIRCWGSSQLHSNIYFPGPSMRTQMAFPGNVDSVCDRAVRSHLLKHRPRLWKPPRSYWISHLHPRKWGIPWTRTYYRSYPGKRGWLPPIWKNLRQIYHSEPDFVVASRLDETLSTVRQWVQMGAPPAWSECSELSPELRCWRLQFGNLSVDTEGRLWRRRAPPATSSQLVVPIRECQEMIRRYHDSIFTGHLGVSRTVYRLLDRVYWPSLRQDVRSYLASCSVCLARKSPCPRRAPMEHVAVGHRWDRVAMDILDMSVTTPKGNHYVLVIVD